MSCDPMQCACMHNARLSHMGEAVPDIDSRACARQSTFPALCPASAMDTIVVSKGTPGWHHGRHLPV